jgi:UDP:flavonoid glycosyltransferase YjiC (YdhE family)
MCLLISTVGSSGDVLPFVRLAAQMRRRGHEVFLYANPMHEALVDPASAVFRPLGNAQAQRTAQADARINESRSGLTLVAAFVINHARPTWEAMKADVLPGQTLLLGSTFAFGARLLRETDGLPFVAAQLAPSVLRSEHRAARLSPMGSTLERWPRPLKRLLWRGMDRRFLDPLFTEPLNRLRAELNLPPVSRVMHHWIHEGEALLGLFPPGFAPRQPDWPAALELTGFPLPTEPAPPLAPELDHFLTSGPPPIVFTAGTANRGSQAFYAESAAACARGNHRGLLVAASPDQVPPTLPAGVQHVTHAPFETLLPRAAGIVHHAGIGTLAQALAAGIPQLLRPMAYDQFDNADLARRLGVAIELLPRAYQGQRLDDALRRLTTDSAWRARCATAAQTLAQPGGVEAACDVLERTLREHHPRPQYR